MIALRHITRPSRREYPKGDMLHNLKPLVEPRHKEAESAKEKPQGHKPEFKAHQVKTRFNSRATWRHSYARYRKAKTTAERAMSGDWRVIGRNRTPLIARTEQAGVSIISMHQEGRLETATKKPKLTTTNEAREQIHRINRRNGQREIVQLAQTELGLQTRFAHQIQYRLPRLSANGTSTDLHNSNSSLTGNLQVPIMRISPAEIEATESEGFTLPTNNGQNTSANGVAQNIGNVSVQSTSANSQWQISIITTNQPSDENLDSRGEETTISRGAETKHNAITNPNGQITNANGQTNNDHRFGFGIKRIAARLSISDVNTTHVGNSEIKETNSSAHATSGRRSRRSRYVQTYSRRRQIRLRIVQASVTPPER